MPVLKYYCTLLRSNIEPFDISTHLSEWLSSKRQEISAGEDVEKGTLCTVGEDVNWYSRDENRYGGSSKVKNRATI